MVLNACVAIESAENEIPLTALAANYGLSPHHFHRVFKRIAGITPKGYATAWKNRQVEAVLRSGSGVTDAIYAAGFNSASRFYAAAPRALGMKPTAYRKGGEGEEIAYEVGRCSLGYVLVAATAIGVCAILFGDDPESLAADLRARFPKAALTAKPGASGWLEQVVDFLDGRRARKLDLPLDIRGTSFQCRVWQALRDIPPGRTESYAAVAARVGSPGSARAVAGACAANPLAVAIPCHRVVASDGALAGYRWGIRRKRELLERERAEPGPLIQSR
jgi:AraC family transcriptional regulator of adaptative response/methylated-DNA-[protein]-cysteine methyltransferase